MHVHWLSSATSAKLEAENEFREFYIKHHTWRAGGILTVPQNMSCMGGAGYESDDAVSDRQHHIVKNDHILHGGPAPPDIGHIRPAGDSPSCICRMRPYSCMADRHIIRMRQPDTACTDPRL